jgi:hypothetical protein
MLPRLFKRPIMGRPKSLLNSLSDEELLDYCRVLYGEHGPEALTYRFLKTHRGLYFILFGRGITQKSLAARLGLAEEMKIHLSSRPMVRSGRAMVRRSWPQLVEEARLVVEAHGSLPPAQWFQRNGRASLVQSIRSGKLGMPYGRRQATPHREPSWSPETACGGEAIRKRAFPIFCTRGASSIGEVTDIPKSMRLYLAEPTAATTYISPEHPAGLM